jgi:hypothetical protein
MKGRTLMSQCVRKTEADQNISKTNVNVSNIPGSVHRIYGHFHTAKPLRRHLIGVFLNTPISPTFSYDLGRFQAVCPSS